MVLECKKIRKKNFFFLKTLKQYRSTRFGWFFFRILESLFLAFLFIREREEKRVCIRAVYLDFKLANPFSVFMCPRFFFLIPSSPLF